jgi:hypothetical protein
MTLPNSFKNILPINSFFIINFLIFNGFSSVYGQIPMAFIEDITSVYGDKYNTNLKGKPKVIIERYSDEKGISTSKYDENGNLNNYLYELEDPDGFFCPKRIERNYTYDGKIPVKTSSSKRCNVDYEYVFETSSGRISNAFEFYMPKYKDNYILYINNYGYNSTQEKHYLQGTVSILVKSSGRKIMGTDLVLPNYDIIDNYSYTYDDKLKLKRVYQIDKSGDTLRLHVLDDEGRIKSYIHFCIESWSSENLKGCYGSHFEYNKDGLSASTDIDREEIIKTVYTTLNYDVKGNWIEQNVKIFKNGKQSNEYTKYRSFTYYD